LVVSKVSAQTVGADSCDSLLISAEAYSMPNPFTYETKISFNCREMALLKFEIYDILGKKVYVGSEQVFDKGENTITILGKDLPHGILYGRFVSLDGSAKTIKLRKTE
jgi:hypothetical protein